MLRSIDAVIRCVMITRVDKQQVAARFDKAASSYDAHDLLQREVAERALERLDYVNIDPRLVIDLGSGTGRCARELTRRYREARVVHYDLAPSMLAAARKQAPRWFSRERYVCGDIEKLPLAERIFDLAFSSLALQWCGDPAAAFAEVRRTLKPAGLFLFTTLGPDTLRELRSAFASVSQAPHVSTFLDMHDIGDALGRSGFNDPVMECEYITVTYDDVLTLMRDLKGIGATNASDTRARGLLGRGQLKGMLAAYETYRVDGKLPATYEIIFGHAWAADGPPPQSGAEHHFPLSRLKRR